ncbi:MAG: hypothetical protein IPN72_19335 [Saprospiraceae bacterium]|nr:hypothetical protein [Saprospiraceae bacterium]
MTAATGLTSITWFRVDEGDTTSVGTGSTYMVIAPGLYFIQRQIKQDVMNSCCPAVLLKVLV